MPDPITRLNAALEGRYRIESQLGEGGMATVYLADDLRHERKVALKVLKPELAAVVGAERFLAEIKTTANLQHPHILPLFDSGEADTFLFYVMPYVEGETLRDRLDREHQLPVDEAVQIAKNVAEALDYAHSRGVIHRDIKPANILLQAGKPVISDFGIALAVGVAGGGRLTETGLSLGTPHYMSPEQATGDVSVGAATDIYALGCVLYEMLVGDPPHVGSTAQAILGKIVTGDADPVTKHRKAVPANVDAAIKKALEKVPADRFTRSQGFSDALADPGFGHGQRTEGTAVVRGQWTPVAIGLGALALISAVGLGWSLSRTAPAQPVTRQYLDTDGWLDGASELGRRVAIAPDGSSMVVPIPADGGGHQLGLKPRSSAQITPIPGTEGARDVVFSPTGEWIAYAVGVELLKQPLAGGSPLLLAEDLGLGPTGVTARAALAWLDDGTLLYEQFAPSSEGSPRRLVRISEDGGDLLDVVFGGGEEEVFIAWSQGLPDARSALVIANGQVHIVDLQDHSAQVLFEPALRAWYAPSGHLVYVQRDGTLLAQPFDLGAQEVTGPAMPLFAGVNTSGPTVAFPHASAVLGADGTLLYTERSASATADRHLVVVDLQGNEQTLALAPRPIVFASWSPDGESVVFSGGGAYTYNVEVGSTPRQVTADGGGFPVYSPDGTQVVFSRGNDLVVQDLDEASPPRVILDLEGDLAATQWFSDTLLFFEWGPRSTSDSWDLGVLNLADPESPRADVYLQSEAILRDLVVSPDGAVAAYRSNESGRTEIYVRSFPEPGAPTRVSLSGGEVPFWSPDGSTLYYARSNVGGTYTFFAARLQRDPVPAVLSTDSLFTGRYGFQPFSGSGLHPDGDRWILSQPVQGGAGAVRVLMVQNFFEELRERVPN